MLLSKVIYNYLCSQCISPLSCEFESCSGRGVLDTTLSDKVCQWLATGRWFSSGTPFSSSDKTDSHDIIEILLKRALNTITLTHNCFKKVIKLVIFWCSFIACFRTGWSEIYYLHLYIWKWSSVTMTLKIKVKCVLIHLSIMLLDTQNWRIHICSSSL